MPKGDGLAQSIACLVAAGSLVDFGPSFGDFVGMKDLEGGEWVGVGLKLKKP